MLATLRHTLQGTLALLVIAASTIVLTVVLFFLAMIKFLLPKGSPRHALSRALAGLAEFWSSINQAVTGLYRSLEWEVSLPEGIDRRGRYLIFSNHQSWVDIVALQQSLNRRAPFMRFLMKQQLIWVPFLGFAWWALDYAFLKRYSREQMLKDPSLRGKDLENTARSCEKLKHLPVSMMTFPEGTRFTLEKRREQKSPYKHLLRPRYGGVGQVLYSFEDALDGLLDTTIVYPHGVPSMWQLLSGRVRKINLHVRLLPIPDSLRGVNFRDDKEARNSLRKWVDGIWAEKDAFITYALGMEATEPDTINP
jgi:1-acyl-sn-glycerol-3-phosphate acyltransferase